MKERNPTKMNKEWHDFFITTGGAAAALAGLLFVGVSLNLQKILSMKRLPERALISLVLLMNILIVSILMLVPWDSPAPLGFELLFTGLILYFFVFRLDLRNYKHTGREFKNRYLLNLFLDQLASIPYMICGAVILISGEAGIFWIVPAIFFSFIKSVLDAWVLLVEINR